MQFLAIKSFGNPSGGLNSHLSTFTKAWKLNPTESLTVNFTASEHS